VELEDAEVEALVVAVLPVDTLVVALVVPPPPPPSAATYTGSSTQPSAKTAETDAQAEARWSRPIRRD
jgi:hypothetical protein